MKTELGASRGEARMALWEARSCLRRMVGVSVIDWNDVDRDEYERVVDDAARLRAALAQRVIGAVW